MIPEEAMVQVDQPFKLPSARAEMVAGNHKAFDNW